MQIERAGSSNEGVRQEAVLALLGFMQATGPHGVLERMQVPGEHELLGHPTWRIEQHVCVKFRKKGKPS